MSEDNIFEPQPGSAAQKLTDWVKEPKLNDLKQDYESARESHSAQISEVNEWIDNLKVRGAAKPKPGANRSGVQPKLIRKQAEWRYANLSEPFLSSPDMFDVSPVTWEDTEAAVQNGLVINHQFNHKLNKQLFIDNMVRAAVDEGTAIIKVGWSYQYHIETVEKPIFTVTPDASQQTMQYLTQIDALYKQSPSQYNEVPPEWQAAYQASINTGGMGHSPTITGYQEVDQEVTDVNQPTLEVCNIRNVIIDPTCGGDVSKAQFIIHRFESSLSDLKKDGRYSNLEFIKPDDASPLSEPDFATNAHDKSFEFKDEARQKLVVYEYWGYYDIDGSGITTPIVAAWVGGVKIRMEQNPFPDQKLPFVTIAYLPKANSVYGESDGSLLIDNQKLVGAITRGLVDSFAKSANSQTGIAKGTLDAVNRRKFERGEDYEFNPGHQPQNMIFQHEFPQIPQSAQFMIEMSNNEAESITGVKAFNSGIGGNGLGDTATGVRGALDAASKRELGLLRRLSKGMTEVGRKIISMNQEWMDDIETVRITNNQFVQVRRDDIQGFFDLDLSISTAEEDNAKAQELAFMMQTLGNNVDWGITSKILANIARLRKMPQLAHEIEQYQPQPDPFLQQQQQLQLQLLNAQIATEQARAASFGAQANLNTVKQGTEAAKANHLQAAADMTNLNFVEQESGVTQERNLQTQAQHAQNQLGLKVADSQLRQQEANQMNKQSS